MRVPVLSVNVLVAQSSPTLCNRMNCSLPGSLVHGLLQERILQWVAISSSRGSSWSRSWTYISCISCIGRQILYQSHLTSSSALPSACLDPSFLLSPQPVPIPWPPSHPSKPISNASSFIKAFLIALIPFPKDMNCLIWNLSYEAAYLAFAFSHFLSLFPM